MSNPLFSQKGFPKGEVPRTGNSVAKKRRKNRIVALAFQVIEITDFSFQPIDTLPIPHGVEDSAGGLAERVRVLRSDDESVALELQLVDESWLGVDGTSGKNIAKSVLDAQGRYAIARVKEGVTCGIGSRAMGAALAGLPGLRAGAELRSEPVNSTCLFCGSRIARRSSSIRQGIDGWAS